MVLIRRWWPDFLNDVHVKIMLGAFYVWFLCWGILLILSIKTSGKEFNRRFGDMNKNIQLFLPRLAAGIILGFLFQLADESWCGIFDERLNFGDNFSICLFIGRIFMPLCGVLIYVFIEMNNVPGIKVGYKPFHILLRGYSYAVLIGVLASDIFGKSLGGKYAANSSSLQGVFGVIYPEVILYQAPLALFVGIFLQLLWEDKTLTDKI
jgi:hypothetical protein